VSNRTWLSGMGEANERKNRRNGCGLEALNDAASGIGLYLAIEEVARMLGISVEAARALVKAGLPALQDKA
jgi:hypothetical protein